MKNNNIEQKIISRFSEITISENPSSDILERIKNNINKAENSKSNKKTNKSLLKPVFAATIFIVLIAAVAAAAPIILKMLGSDIGFFDSDRQTRYSADHEIIKQYSSEVGITAKGDGFSFTLDNIAYDGTFMSVFYTVTKDTNIYEETKEQIKNWRSTSTIYGNDKFIIQTALLNNEIYMEIPGYIERLTIEQYLDPGVNPSDIMHDALKSPMIDGYFVSDYELKGLHRYTIAEDLPDIFDIEISYQNYPYSYDGYLNRLRIPLTIDISESKIEKTVVTPNLSATVIQPKIVVFPEETREDIYPEIPGEGYTGIISVEHNIIIDRVSISPLGNILLFTEKGSDNPVNRELFSNYFITDDKGNAYGRMGSSVGTRKNQEEDKTVVVEFFGNVPSDAQYLKLTPYIIDGSLGYDKTELGNLPRTVKENEYGNVIIESCIVTDEEVIINYKHDGMVSLSLYPILTVADGEKPLRGNRGYTTTMPIYSRSTDSYTSVLTFVEPLENAANIVTGIEIAQYNIELLEEQAIIISLK